MLKLQMSGEFNAGGLNTVEKFKALWKIFCAACFRQRQRLAGLAERCWRLLGNCIDAWGMSVSAPISPPGLRHPGGAPGQECGRKPMLAPVDAYRRSAGA
jgi:hypothetical protein